MDNDYLRLDSDERLVDSQVNEYAVKTNYKKQRNNKGNTAISFILDEIYSKKNLVDISENVSKKPKLLDAIFFSLSLLLFSFLISVVTYYVRAFFLLELTVFCYSAIIPVSILYFFYRLDVNGRIKFSTLAYSALFGISAFIIIEIIFTKLINQALHDYYSSVAVRCLVELILVVVIAYFLRRGVRGGTNISGLVIACAVAVGFSFSNALADNFSALLVNVSVSNTGYAVGAIINIEEFIRTSISNVISTFATISIYKPFLFIALTVIIFRSLTNNLLNLKKKVVTIFFTFLFCIVTYVLSSLKTPFDFLMVLYNLIAIAFTLYLFITAINGSVKLEKYE